MSIRTDYSHADRMIKRRPEMFFTVLESITDAFLFSNVLIKFFDVGFCQLNLLTE